ncbi:uncharacterized protein LOC111396409 [Olea europaea var. sylvestris]|uniref:uncharacterized protein LOC111396409 n=1 Tax=Olea europaea var. sylvestris TaxID=158386 RepID=UPI000C1D5887|nr:uncharacterized protein LOC111396409 [Olea europaea var. sylvestris]
MKVWTREVWRSFITPKHAFILWLGAQSKLLTKYRLPYLDIDKNCVFCERHLETGQHLFFQCSFASSIWMKIKVWTGIRRSMTTIPSALKWMKKEARGTSWQSKSKSIALASTVYHIWMARNRKVFEEPSPHVDSIHGSHLLSQPPHIGGGPHTLKKTEVGPPHCEGAVKEVVQKMLYKQHS